ncbi:MAG TPA: mevalonate kinase [archaeon]|nr:mevalonate kinase [archaeon]
MEKGAVGIGWGKAILFGEHFVVYGFPGIAASIELNTTCKFVKANPGDGITSNDLVSGEKIKYGQHKYKTLDRVIDAILKQTKIEERNFKLDLETNMSLKGGMGSSAALCVSITRCLSEQFSLKLSDEQVNRISFEAEKVFHSNPSGIDNTVSAYGGMIWFEKKQPINFIERMKSKPVEVVFADTGIFHNTAEIVAMVSHQKDADRKKYQRIFMDYKEIVYPARGLIEKGKWKEVGELMNKNQKLLEEINVSNEANDLLVQTSLQNGALGAKVTGAGLGGNVLALTPGQKLQEQVAKAIEREGFTAYKIKIGVNKNAI